MKICRIKGEWIIKSNFYSLLQIFVSGTEISQDEYMRTGSACFDMWTVKMYVNMLSVASTYVYANACIWKREQVCGACKPPFLNHSVVNNFVFVYVNMKV
jgi:hypothetical protein